MPNNLSVGIVVPANAIGGISKLAGMMASDLAGSGHKISLYMPVLPYYYYFVTMRHRPLSWMKAMLPYVGDWALHHRFVFQDILENGQINARISANFVPRLATKRQLKGIDWLILNGIADIIEYRNRFPQERQVYLVHNVPERAHGHADEFDKIRQAFKGRIVAISPFVARELSDLIETPPVVPNPISARIWRQRLLVDPKVERRDLLLYWKNNESGRLGSDIIKRLLQLRPDTSVTVWFRKALDTTKAGVREAFPDAKYAENIGEPEVADLLLAHSLLLFPQTFEEFGMPPVEALACGCVPVLHPNVGAAEMYARDGDNSVFLSENPEESARKIRDVLDSRQVLQSLRRSAPASITAFDPDRYGHRILEAAGVL